jgi:fatty acid desaturase
MNDYGKHEFAALRETIRSRGTARPAVALAGLIAWAVVLVAVLAWLPNPVASVVPLVILLAAFEAVRTLHLAVERIGRYIQVFFEADLDGRAPTSPPAWEHTAMQMGPKVPGAGGHPYFVAVFLVAAVVNFLAVVFPGPVPVELAALAIPHLAFIVWMLYCDRGMRKQRTTELARFRALKDSLRSQEERPK